MKNGLNIFKVLNLLINLNIFIQHEKNKQNGLYKLLTTNKKNCIINILNEFAKFQLINIKLYYNEENKYNNIKNKFLNNEFKVKLYYTRK